MAITSLEFQMMQQRTEAARRGNATNATSPLIHSADACEQESELHQQIIEHARTLGWVAFRGSMAHRTYRVPGEPDFILATHGGRTVYVECKTRTGKLTQEQLAVKHQLECLGHRYLVVRSFQEFINLINQPT